MRFSKTPCASIIGAALVCGLVHANPARAQDGTIITQRHIVINGPNGTQELQINGTGANGDQVMVLSISGADGLFSFIGNSNDLPFGGSLGPFGLVTMAAGSANLSLVPIDPGVSYIHQLIKRADVRSDLFLDSKQREQLEALDEAEKQAAQQRIIQLDGAINGVQGDKAGAAQGAIADRAKALHELAQGTADERDRKLAAILTPKQIKRLKELDLQYRGPLAMGVKPISSKALLTDAQAPAVADLLKEYRDSVRKKLGVEQNITRSTGPDGSNSVSVNSSISTSPDEMKARMEKAYDEIEQSRRLLGDKALKAVTDTQRSQWKDLTGTRFQFQTLN